MTGWFGPEAVVSLVLAGLDGQPGVLGVLLSLQKGWSLAQIALLLVGCRLLAGGVVRAIHGLAPVWLANETQRP